MFWKMINLFCNNYDIIVTEGIIMASMLIVLIGCLKPLVFNKISNKCVRGVALSLTNIGLAFLFVACEFWIKQISFEYYLCTSIAFCVFTIFVYWCYENLTQARVGVQKLGGFLWKKIAAMLVNKVNSIATDTKELTNIITSTTNPKKEKPKRKDDLSKF